MADIFKDGILYMEDLHDSDIFSDIIKKQNEDEQKQIEEEKLKKEKSEKEQKIEEIQEKVNECIREISEKINKSNDNEILFENNIIYCSNGYGIKIIEQDNKKIINLVIP